MRKSRWTRVRAVVAAVAMMLVWGNASHGAEIEVKIENLQGDGGLFFTPVWIGAHNGTFDSYTTGEPASNFPGLEEIAELGNTGPLSTGFLNGSAGLAGGVDATVIAAGGAAPVFEPGESETFVLDVGDASVNRYFSYATMVIPSNDLFFANGSPVAHQLFDAGGNFTGPLVINIFGNNVIDAGTEVNDILGGAAFSANGGPSADENGLIANLFASDPGGVYLGSLVGSQTVTGATITEQLGAATPLARITVGQVIPEPGVVVMLGAGVVGLLMRRGRREVGVV